MERDEYTRMFRRERTHWFAIGRRRILQTVLANYVPRRPIRVLEIGSGTGGNIPMLSGIGTLTCIEMSDYARALSRERLGEDLDLRAGTWPGKGILGEDEVFDLIVLLDVVEHMDQPVEALALASRHMAPGARLVATVPAYQWMWSVHDEQLHHKRRYSSKGIMQTMVDAGLKPIYWSYFNTILLPAAVIARLSAKWMGHDRSPGQSVPRHIVNSVFLWIFAQERRWIGRGRAPFGLSLVVVAERAS